MRVGGWSIGAEGRGARRFVAHIVSLYQRSTRSLAAETEIERIAFILAKVKWTAKGSPWGQAVYDGTAGIAEAEKLAHFVERLAAASSRVLPSRR